MENLEGEYLIREISRAAGKTRKVGKIASAHKEGKVRARKNSKRGKHLKGRKVRGVALHTLTTVVDKKVKGGR